jgi:disulfide bond formation protein DsbB
VIVTRRRRRWLNLGGVAIVVGLMAYAYFAEYVQGLEPCPLCIFQRVAMVGLGIVFLIAGLHSPLGAVARVYAVLGFGVAGIGAAIAGRHVYVQNLPPDRVPECTPGLDYLVEVFPWTEVVRKVLTGSGECAEINWSFLGLSMPAWVLIWFVALGGLAVVADWSRLGGSGFSRDS